MGINHIQNNNPMVSAVMTAYNCEKYIRYAIQSVLAQTYTNFEFIIVDDGSTDGTANLIQYFDDPRIIFVRLEKNTGVPGARNTAIDLIRGKWWTSIDADDTWHKERLSKLVEVAKRHPKALIADDLWICLSGKNCELIPWKSFFLKIGLKKLFKNESVMNINASVYIDKRVGLIQCLFPTEIIKQYNIKYSKLNHCHDMEFDFQVLKLGVEIYLLNEPLYYYRLTPKEADNSFASAGYLRVMKAYEHMLKDSGVAMDLRKALEKEYDKISQYHGFAGSIRDGNWRAALSVFRSSPQVALDLLKNIPQNMSRRWLAFRKNAYFK